MAFEKIAPAFPELKLIAVGPDKYESPVIKSLVTQVNDRLNREAVVHKDYVEDGELVELYAGAKALIYVSDRGSIRPASDGGPLIWRSARNRR